MTGKKHDHRRPLKILWSHRARIDLLAIGDHIAADNPSAAARWVQRLVASVERASHMPLAGRRVPEYSDRQDIREMLVRSYRIVYRVQAETIEVLAIFEGHRRFPNGAVADDDS